MALTRPQSVWLPGLRTRIQHDLTEDVFSTDLAGPRSVLDHLSMVRTSTGSGPATGVVCPRQSCRRFAGERPRSRHPLSVPGAVVEARRRRARRPRSLRSTRPSSAAAARRAAKSSASSNSGPMMADSWPMSRRMVASVREAINGSVTPSIQTRVRRPSPRSSPVIRSRANMRSARANFPKPRATMRESDTTWPSWHSPPTPASSCLWAKKGVSGVVSPRKHPRHLAACVAALTGGVQRTFC